ncbi:TPA: stage 0 sporulation protein [Candidatus Berkelbacteria bacterium]|uniref:Signal peptidase-like protein, no function established n=1 Tax=Berkelbacteria bacterium GW2011_GWE1_39_12 TaxID=1618337 RepID=A0A0G4B4H9_9BACT|nr:MAG: signal peptidase-like protein, no function established [Berkelbacteria bacterium GW2011_GWE1_39_12]HBO60484.1 stage 0 sporulation protein [Candidatus Berkelbacteria bacterium]
MRIKIPTTGQLGNVAGDYKIGQELVIEADGIMEPAIVLCEIDCSKLVQEQKTINVIREFTDQDKATKKQLKTQAVSFLEKARSKVFRHGLDMKILDADLSFDQKKLTLYFSADGRIDFRALVADMVGDFNKLIRLQQVGPREETKLFGGFGKCGRQLCCASFLNNLDNVTLDMAEVQDAGSVKSPKLAGCCGKLMCCLSYEANLYKDEKAKLPKVGSFFKSKDGEGKVLSQNVLEGRLTLETKDGKRIEVTV